MTGRQRRAGGSALAGLVLATAGWWAQWSGYEVVGMAVTLLAGIVVLGGAWRSGALHLPQPAEPEPDIPVPVEPPSARAKADQERSCSTSGPTPPLPVRTGTTRRLPRLAALLQSPPRTHRTRRQTTRQPRPQPHWAIHQGAAPEPSAASRRSALAWSSSAMSSQSGPKARRSSAASRNSAASSGFCRHAIR